MARLKEAIKLLAAAMAFARTRYEVECRSVAFIGGNHEGFTMHSPYVTFVMEPANAEWGIDIDEFSYYPQVAHTVPQTIAGYATVHLCERIICEIEVLLLMLIAGTVAWPEVPSNASSISIRINSRAANGKCCKRGTIIYTDSRSFTLMRGLRRRLGGTTRMRTRVGMVYCSTSTVIRAYCIISCIPSYR